MVTAIKINITRKNIMHMYIVCSIIPTDTWIVVISKSCCCLTNAWTNKKNTAPPPQGPPTDAPAVDTAEQVYISSLALLKVTPLHHIISSKYMMSIKNHLDDFSWYLLFLRCWNMGVLVYPWRSWDWCWENLLMTTQCEWLMCLPCRSQER